MAAASSHPKKSAYHHGDLAAALLDAGERLLAETGPEALSLRALARACGVSQAAPYRHFADKEALLAALARRAFEDFAAALAAAGRSGPGVADPRDRLIALGRAYVAYGLAYPHRLRLMFGATRSAGPDKAAFAAAADAAMAELEAAAAAAAPGADVKTTALAAWSLVHGFTMLALDLPDDKIIASRADLDRQLTDVLQTFVLGLPA